MYHQLESQPTDPEGWKKGLTEEQIIEMSKWRDGVKEGDTSKPYTPRRRSSGAVIGMANTEPKPPEEKI